MYLLDTNVISELRRPRPHGAVVAWLEGTADDLQSVLALLVPPELVKIDKLDSAGAPTLSPPPLVHGDHDEFFVDPDEFRRKREQLLKDDRDIEPSPA